ncbi:MAG: class I SAM-dependent methyltransferase [Opitutaceae bacterium]
MKPAVTDPTRRFSNRVDDYVRYRPHYPAGVLEILRAGVDLTPQMTIADIGSGTGISAGLFLGHGNPVFAVEPNREMRAAAEQLLHACPGFRSVNGTAEATTLPDATVDCIVAAQAFHWFEAERTRAEFRRILRPGGWVVLLWNTRLKDATPFLRAYEELLQKYGTDYAQVQHERIDAAALGRFYAPGFQQRVLPNAQSFDYAGLRGRLLSSSYAPGPGDPRHEPMLAALQKTFQQHQQGGRVRFEYETEIYYGHV